MWEKARLKQANLPPDSAMLAASTPGKQDARSPVPPHLNPITPSPAALKASSSFTTPRALTEGNTVGGSESATVQERRGRN